MLSVIRFKSAKLSHKGLDVLELAVDRREAIIKYYNGGPVGLETLAAATGEEAVTIEDVYEPYLLQLGFIARTPRGRICLPDGYKHMGMRPSVKARRQISMFDPELGINPPDEE